MTARLPILLTAVLVLGAGCIGSAPDEYAVAANAAPNETNATATPTPNVTVNNTTTPTPSPNNTTTTPTPSPNNTTTTPTPSPNNTTTTPTPSPNNTTTPTPSPNNTTTPTPNDTTENPDDGTTTPDADQSETTQATEAARLAAAHVEALRDAGSFVRRTEVNVEVVGENATWSTGEFGGVDLSLPTRMAVDLEQGRMLSTANVAIATMTDYASFDDGTVYRKMGGNGTEPTYRVMDAAECGYPATGPALLDALRQSTARELAAASFSTAGTETVRGTTVTRYVASGMADHSFQGANSSEILDAETVVLVGEDGLVHRIERSRTVQSAGVAVRQTVVVEYVDPGETSVEKPGWLDEARGESSD